MVKCIYFYMRLYLTTIYVYSGVHSMHIIKEYGDIKISYSYEWEFQLCEVNIYSEHISGESSQYGICVNMLMFFLYKKYNIKST